MGGPIKTDSAVFVAPFSNTLEGYGEISPRKLAPVDPKPFKEGDYAVESPIASAIKKASRLAVNIEGLTTYAAVILPSLTGPLGIFQTTAGAFALSRVVKKAGEGMRTSSGDGRQGVSPAEVSGLTAFLAELPEPFRIRIKDGETKAVKVVRNGATVEYDPAATIIDKDGVERKVIKLKVEVAEGDRDESVQRTATARAFLYGFEMELRRLETKPVIQVNAFENFIVAMTETIQDMIDELNRLRFAACVKVTGRTDSQEIYDSLKAITIQPEEFRALMKPIKDKASDIKMIFDVMGISTDTQAGRMLAGISHDYNNRLFGLVGYDEYVLTPQVEDGKEVDLRPLFPARTIGAMVDSIGSSNSSSARGAGVTINTPVLSMLPAALTDVQLGKRQIEYYFRIVNESVRNAIIHSGGKNVTVKVGIGGIENDVIYTEIADDGKGMPESKWGRDSVAPDAVTGRMRDHFGARNMVDLVTLLGGKIQMSSSSEGTVIRITLPIKNMLDSGAKAPLFTMDRRGGRIEDFSLDAAIAALHAVFVNRDNVEFHKGALATLNPTQINDVVLALNNKPPELDGANKALSHAGLRLIPIRDSRLALGLIAGERLVLPNGTGPLTDDELKTLEDLLVFISEEPVEVINAQLSELSQLYADPVSEKILFVATSLLRHHQDLFRELYDIMISQPSTSPISVTNFIRQLPASMHDVYFKFLQSNF